MKEQSLLHIVLIYLAVINMVTFFMYGIDKWKAKNRITSPDDLAAFSYEGFEYEPTLGEPNYPHFIKQ